MKSFKKLEDEFIERCRKDGAATETTELSLRYAYGVAAREWYAIGHDEGVHDQRVKTLNALGAVGLADREGQP